MKELCTKIANLVNNHLLDNVTDPEILTFYLKIIADYHRYTAELLTGEAQEPSLQASQQAYQKACEAARNLHPTHPMRLGLALNYAVFAHDILNDASRARKLAANAFEDAKAQR